MICSNLNERGLLWGLVGVVWAELGGGGMEETLVISKLVSSYPEI